ncbi:MAG: hypothetical protein GYA17_00750 [Chloroflexi bacterium]|nr:hypothetical protein [Chloroflexota bacterium]
MILVNFAHPFTNAQTRQIEALCGMKISQTHHHPAQFDVQLPFPPQVRALVDQVGLSAESWQTEALLINPPSLSIITAILLAELHGRSGHFPAVVRLKPLPGPVTQFDVAEIINLQALREQARQARQEN